MPLPDEPCLTGEIFEEGTVLSLHDLKQMFAVEERHIVEWVEEGVIDVLEVDAVEWRFRGSAVRRARIALRLERDLGVNAPGVALALELLEELEQLRRERRVGHP
ncbi:MAG TPA: chaperone modulator CbpM [Steroidobacteraceae bacterium]|jgi:chaperone modulatory protein CbpM|nr:chaperone modulator CbpM [Steroidobacteraceae bacterium]